MMADDGLAARIEEMAPHVRAQIAPLASVLDRYRVVRTDGGETPLTILVCERDHTSCAPAVLIAMTVARDGQPGTPLWDGSDVRTTQADLTLLALVEQALQHEHEEHQK